MSSSGFNLSTYSTVPSYLDQFLTISSIERSFTPQEIWEIIELIIPLTVKSGSAKAQPIARGRKRILTTLISQSSVRDVLYVAIKVYFGI